MNRRWNSLDNVAVPALLVTGEATWVALWVVSVWSQVGPGVRAPGFLALVVPALVAVTLAGSARGRVRSSWHRALGLAVVLVVGMAVSAGLVADVLGSSAVVATMAHPWTVAAGHGRSISIIAWTVAVASWGRGAWLAARGPRFRQGAVSGATGLVAYVALFVFLILNSSETLHRATHLSVLFVICYFTSTLVALARLREREIEAGARVRELSPPSSVWLSVVGLGVLVICGLGLLASVVVGSLAPGVAPVVWRSAKPGGARRPSYPSTTAPLSRGLNVGLHLPAWLVFVLVAVAFVAVAVLLVRWIAPVIPRLRLALSRMRAVTETDDAEGSEVERDSVFSWRHIRDLLRAGMLALLRRASTAVRAPHSQGERESDSVRGEYRRFLGAMVELGFERRRHETAHELEVRLAGHLLAAALPGEGLVHLTGLYEAVRYGASEDGDERAVALARREVDRLLDGLDVGEESIPGAPLPERRGERDPDR